MGSSEGAFFAAIEAGAADEVRAMVTAEPSLASARDEQGVSAVMRARYRFDEALLDAVLSGDPALDVFEAASLGDVERVRELLDADPSAATAYSADGFTALHFPAFFGGVACARALVERGADVDAHGRGWMTGTPLNSAAAGVTRTSRGCCWSAAPTRTHGRGAGGRRCTRRRTTATWRWWSCCSRTAPTPPRRTTTGRRCSRWRSRVGTRT